MNCSIESNQCTPARNCLVCANFKRGFFADLQPESVQKLNSSKQERKFDTKEIILHEGDSPLGLFCVQSGKVKIYKTDFDGNQQIVRIASAGDMLGYRSLLAQEPYAASAEALDPVVLCYLDKNVFYDLLYKNTTMTDQILKILAKDLGRAENQLFRTSYRSLRERLAELLIVLKNRYGKRTARGILLEIFLTREELAEMIGTTPESVIRAIKDFKSEGIISTTGREICITNLPHLIEAASLNEM